MAIHMSQHTAIPLKTIWILFVSLVSSPSFQAPLNYCCCVSYFGPARRMFSCVCLFVFSLEIRENNTYSFIPIPLFLYIQDIYNILSPTIKRINSLCSSAVTFSIQQRKKKRKTVQERKKIAPQAIR